jgi:transmembrane 9 superfamily protein 2/4
MSVTQNNRIRILLLNFFCLILVNLFLPISSDVIKDFYSYKLNDTLLISVGSMNSIEVQIPFDYYYLNICRPQELIQEPDNLGEILTGDKSYQTNYVFQMGQNEYCRELCSKKFSLYDASLLKWFVSRNYTTSWYVDKLLAGMKHVVDIEKFNTEVHYLGGIPLGYMETMLDGSLDYKIYNHYTFTILIHSESDKKFTVVGFNIMPFSIKQNSTTGARCGNKEEYMRNFRAERQSFDSEEEILFTYDIVFEKSNIAFSSRWDHYLHLQNDKIHWFSLINGGLFILIPSFIILHIFCRSLKRDIDIYNSRVTGEDFIDEFGWKQVCNDVFRKPSNKMLLSALIGSGIQLFSMVIYTIIIAMIAFITPEHRGAMLMSMIFIFVFMGVFAGYFAARFYKMFGGREWLKMSLLTAFLYPSLLFAVFLIINIMFWMERSSAGVFY